MGVFLKSEFLRELLNNIIVNFTEEKIGEKRYKFRADAQKK